ncbi:MAG TPA: hypothetical protein VJV79_12530 [Polyangiaceae bacterium]|nr:hypothetical protein [Polyangiaceae bacterium]
MGSWGWLSGVFLVASVAGCDAQAPSSDAASGGAAGVGSAPWWTLPPGSRYLAKDGRQAPLLLRNLTAASAAAFVPLLEAAHAAGADAVRVQLTQGFGYDTLGIDSQGAVLSSWAASWDAVFSAAEKEQLAVIPVFGIWGDWNSGVPDHGWTHFAANPLSRANGGPASSPVELLTDSETRRLWLSWLATLIERWHHYPNIIAWETFSELDLVTGANETNATDFAGRARDVIRTHDPHSRPVIASTSDLPLIHGQPGSAWVGRGSDLASIHPYDANLAATVAARVRMVTDTTSKPVIIGESGLDAAPPDGTTLTSSPAARDGLQQAIWTELVSGAASARAFYWEDGYATYYPQTGSAFVRAMNDLDSVAAQWLKGADYTGLVPGTLESPESMPYAVSYVAGENQVRGYARSQALIAPNWSAPPLPSISLSLAFPEQASDGQWSVVFTTRTGEALPPVQGTSSGNALTFSVPGGFTSLAFVATRVR